MTNSICHQTQCFRGIEETSKHGMMQMMSKVALVTYPGLTLVLAQYLEPFGK
jgi:hypothetical protein